MVTPTVTLTVEPTRTISGGTAHLRWTATNATHCAASEGWSGARPTTGTERIDSLRVTTRFILTCTGPQGTTRAVTQINVGSATSSNAFPLRVEPGKRYLIDANDRPFLIHGDSPWSLIVQLTREEVDRYLDDRQARGFNTLLVNLIEHKFAKNAPRNAYGEGPFLSPGDFRTPNPAYFAHADWVLARAAQKGFLVLLVPSYLGYGGGSEGWYGEMVANGTAALRAYGRFLGRRYRNYTNILWTYGGDFNPPHRDVVRAIADGIREFDTRALGTAHCGSETAAIEYWGGESWLQVSNVYTYNPVYPVALRHYQRFEHTPFFLIESTYENEHNATTRQLRAQAYHALLAGASGHVFGNNPIWSFDGPKIFPAPVTWRKALDGPGSRSMAYVWNVFAARPWWTLVLDTRNAMPIEALGHGHNRAVAALAQDRTFGMAYVPIAREVSIDLGQLAGLEVTATWYDPTTGSYRTVNNSPLPAKGVRPFRSNGRNGNGDFDWVLVFESARRLDH
jgi:hypothetical protein